MRPAMWAYSTTGEDQELNRQDCAAAPRPELVQNGGYTKRRLIGNNIPAATTLGLSAHMDGVIDDMRPASEEWEHAGRSDEIEINQGISITDLPLVKEKEVAEKA